MDQQAKELEYLIPGAVVTRMGEGIVVTFDSGLLYDFDSSVIRSDAGQNLRMRLHGKSEVGHNTGVTMGLGIASVDVVRWTPASIPVAFPAQDGVRAGPNLARWPWVGQPL